MQINSYLGRWLNLAVALCLVAGLAGCASKEYYQAVENINKAWAENPRYVTVESNGVKLTVPMQQGGPQMPVSPGQDFAAGASAAGPTVLGVAGLHYFADWGKAAVSAARGNTSYVHSSGTASPVGINGGNGAPQTGTANPTTITDRHDYVTYAPPAAQ